MINQYTDQDFYSLKTTLEQLQLDNSVLKSSLEEIKRNPIDKKFSDISLVSPVIINPTISSAYTQLDTSGNFKIGNYDGGQGLYWNQSAGTLTVKGGLAVGSLDIPDTITANSFHVDNTGNAWWGATTIGAAKAYIKKDAKFFVGDTTSSVDWDVTTSQTLTVKGTINATAGYVGASTALVTESTGLNCGTTGHIRGGQTDFNTGTGFFLGYSGAAYKFSIGVPTGNFLTWDGTSLTIGGVINNLAGDILYASADTNRTAVAVTSYSKIKGITISRPGVYRIKFDLARITSDTAYGKIYKNGVAVGTERTVGGAGYTTFTEDLSGWAAGDEIQIYVKTDGISPAGSQVKNFRIYVLNYDNSTVTFDSDI